MSIYQAKDIYERLIQIGKCDPLYIQTQDCYSCLTSSDDGKTLYLGTRDGYIHIVTMGDDFKPGKTVKLKKIEQPLHKSVDPFFTYIMFIEELDYLVTLDENDMLMAYEVNGGNLKKISEFDFKIWKKKIGVFEVLEIADMCYNEIMNHLVVADQSGKVLIFVLDMENGIQLKQDFQLFDKFTKIKNIAIDKITGDLYIAGTQDFFQLWSLNSGTKQYEEKENLYKNIFRKKGIEISEISFTSKSVSHHTLKKEAIYQGVNCVYYLDECQRIVTGDTHGKVAFWSNKEENVNRQISPEIVYSVSKHGEVLSMVYNAQEKQLVVLVTDEIKIYDFSVDEKNDKIQLKFAFKIRTNIKQAPKNIFFSPQHDICYFKDPKSQLLLSFKNPKKIEFKTIQRAIEHDSRILTVCYLKELKRIISSDEKGKVEVWRLDQNDEIEPIQSLGIHKEPIHIIKTFSESGPLVTLSELGSISLWKIDSNTMIKPTQNMIFDEKNYLDAYFETEEILIVITDKEMGVFQMDQTGQYVLEGWIKLLGFTGGLIRSVVFNRVKSQLIWLTEIEGRVDATVCNVNIDCDEIEGYIRDKRSFRTSVKSLHLIEEHGIVLGVNFNLKKSDEKFANFSILENDDNQKFPCFRQLDNDYELNIEQNTLEMGERDSYNCFYSLKIDQKNVIFKPSRVILDASSHHNPRYNEVVFDNDLGLLNMKLTATQDESRHTIDLRISWQVDDGELEKKSLTISN